MNLKEALKIIHVDLQVIRKSRKLIDFSAQSKKWDSLIDKLDNELNKNLLEEHLTMTLSKTLKRFMSETEYNLYNRHYYTLEMQRMGITDRYLQFVLYDIAFAIHEDSINYYEDNEYDDYYFDRIDDKIISSIQTIYNRLRGYVE